ncbi:hypothetical protein [Reichenbachiella faecimaris]|nr:hypothetical protein [Reichenbachiella faecimaris]
MMVLIASIGVSCTDEDLVEYTQQESITMDNTVSYIQVVTPVVAFQAGTEKYDISFNSIAGYNEISKIDVYKTFTDAVSATGLQTNEVLLKSYDVTATTGTRQVITDEITYADLREGLVLDGGALPADEVDLAIGASWSLRFEATYSDGTTAPVSGGITVGVLHRFAGLYRVIESSYYRIGVGPNADWSGETRFIGSVDENTFSHPDFWGNFAWAGSEFHFDVDYDNDNEITVPIIVDGLFSGSYALNCTDDGADFVSVPCEDQNVVIADDVTGKHIIKLTYGYMTEGSADPVNDGAREFYEIMEKIVD